MASASTAGQCVEVGTATFQVRILVMPVPKSAFEEIMGVTVPMSAVTFGLLWWA